MAKWHSLTAAWEVASYAVYDADAGDMIYWFDEMVGAALEMAGAMPPSVSDVYVKRTKERARAIKVVLRMFEGHVGVPSVTTTKRTR